MRGGKLTYIPFVWRPVNGQDMNATTASNQTALSAEGGAGAWQAWDITIGVNDAIFMLIGFSIGSLGTAVCFMATRHCTLCRKKRDDNDDDDDELIA